MKNGKLLFFTMFFSLSSLIFVFFDYRKNVNIKEHLEQRTSLISLEFNSIYNKYKALSSHVLQTNINNPEILSLYAKAKDANELEKQKIRDLLWSHFKGLYIRLKEDFALRQLHFHLPNNDSFLRMHRPEKFGDNLTFIRNSVAFTNKFKEPTDGFEEGKIFNGFRFVYPIFYQDTHIGSVEISYSPYALILDMTKNYSIASNLLISTNTINKKVFDDEKINYTQSPIKGYSFDEEILQKIKNIQNTKDTKHQLLETTKDLIQKHIPLGKNISFYDEKMHQIVTVLPLKSPVSKEYIAAIISRSEASTIKNIFKSFYLLVSFNILLLLLILFILYLKTNSDMRIKRQNKKIQAIFNSQSIITIITDGEKIEDVNNSFFEFFTQFTSLKEFSQKYDCICDLFEDMGKEDYITREDKKDKRWINLLTLNQNHKYKVCILQDGVKHHFAIKVEPLVYDDESTDNHFIISLMDISGEIEIIQNINNIINYQDNMLVILNEKLELTYANKKFLELFRAQSVDEFKKEFEHFNDIFISHNEYFHSDTPMKWIHDLIKLDESKRVVSILDEEDYTAKAFLINPTYIEESKTWICSFTEYTKLAIQTQTLSKRVYTDELTKVANRAKFNEEILREIGFYKRYDTDFCIALLDIDYFKKINDTYGHNIGDEILKQLSVLVQKNIRNTDLFARWGGEEFVILFHQTTLDETQKVIENLRKNIEDENFIKDIKLTCSFGIAQITQEDTQESLFKRADEALYEAKAAGRNCIRVN